MILSQTTGSQARISDRLVKPTQWTIEQLDLARLRARIVQNIGSKLLLRRAGSLYPLVLGSSCQNVCTNRRPANCVTRSGSYRYNAQSRLYVPLRDLDTADNGKSRNPEQSGSHFRVLTTVFAWNANVKSFIEDWLSGFDWNIKLAAVI